MKSLSSLLLIAHSLLLISLLSITTLAQSPTATATPVVSPTSSATSTPATVSQSPVPTPTPNPDRPNLAFWIEIFACLVMVSGVLTVFVLVRRQQELHGRTIEPRHIQFVSVCLIIPTILILGLEQWLSRETTATLIGGVTGYLLSGLGREKDDRPPSTPPTKPPTSPTSTTTT